MSDWEPQDGPSDEWQPAAQPANDWEPAKASDEWSPVKKSDTGIRLEAAAKMAYGLSPAGYLDQHVVTPALTAAKQFAVKVLPTEQTITPDFQSGNPLMRGVGYAKAATAAAGNALLSQVPESSLGVGGALATGKALGAVAEYGPGIVGKAFPRVGKALASDVGGWAVDKLGSLADWLDKKSAAPEPRPPAEAAGAPEAEPSAAATAPAAPVSAPEPLPVMTPIKEGEPYGLFSYNSDMNPENEMRSLYTIYGDPEHPLIKAGLDANGNPLPGAGFTTQTLKWFKERGIPIKGIEPRAAEKGWQPVDSLSEIRGEPAAAPAPDAAALTPDDIAKLKSGQGDQLPPPTPPAGPPGEPPTEGPSPHLYPPSDFEPSPQRSKADEFQRLMYDRFQPIKYNAGEKIAPEFGNAGGNYTDAYVKARTLAGRTMAQFSDAANELHDLYKPLKNADDLQAFNDLYSLKNHIDLAREGRMTSGVTAEAAQEQINAMKQRMGPENFQRIDDVVENVAKWNNEKGLGILEKAGKITPEAAARWRKQFPHYMPSEVLDDALMNGGQPSALGKIKQNFMKYKSGTDALINENADQMIKKGLLDKISAVNKQQVIDAIADGFGKTIGQEIHREGSVIRTYKADSQIPEGYVESSVKTSDGRIIAVSKQVEQLLQGLNKFQADVATRAIGHYNALFREGATAMRLSFSAGHFIRAAQSALMNTRPTEGAANALRPLASAILSTAKDMIGMSDADMQAFRAAGAAFGGIADPKSVSLPFRLQTLGQKALNVAAIPFKIPARLGRFSDQVIRLNEFKRLAPTEMPEMLKALNARDISIDFEKSGDLLKHINQWVPFINDKMQANVNTARMFRDNPALAAARVASFILAPTMGLYYWNHKFANDDQIDPYIKENYFYINTGKTTMNNGKQVPVVFTIPKKGIYQYLSNATTAMMDYKFNPAQYQQDVKGYGLGQQARSIAAETTPPPAKLVLEPLINQNLYTGRPIVPDSQKFVDPHLQANTASSNTARVIANKTGIPAQVVENMANNVFPATHQFMGLTDKALAAAGVQPVNPQPPNATLQKSQPLQPFLRPASGYYSTQEANANDILQKLQVAAGTPKFMAKQALAQYESNRTPENLAQVDKWMSQLSGADRQRVVESVYKNLNLQQQSPTDRAMARTPGKYRQQVWEVLNK